MGLIKCTECGFEYDDKLDACPECGCPKSINDKKDTPVNETKHKGKGLIIGLLISLIVIAAGITAVLLYVKSIQIQSVTLQGDVKELQVGDEFDLAYTVSPEKAKIKNVSWTSSDASVASVQDGHVITHKSGECVISIEINSKFKADYAITVISLEELQKTALANLKSYVEENSDAKKDGVSMITVGSIDSETDFFIGCKGEDIYLVASKEPKENSADLSCNYTTYVVIESGNLDSAKLKQYNTIDVFGYKADATGDGTISFADYKLGSKVNIDSYKSSLDGVDGIETGVSNDFQQLANNGVKNDFDQLKKFLEIHTDIGCSIEDLQLTNIYE